jgi:hypothetical protein
MLESPDPLVRAAAAHELTQQPWAKARPLVRRMLADPEPGVRARALEIVAAGEAAQALDAIKLYKLVVDDLDSSIRARARARLSRLTAPTKTAAAPPMPPLNRPVATDIDASVAVVASVDTKAVDEAAAKVLAARDEVGAAAAEIEAISRDLTAAIATPADDDRDIRKVKALARAARPIRDRVKAARVRAVAAADAAEKAARASPSPEAEKRAAEARAAACDGDRVAGVAVALSATLDQQADDYAASETSDVDLLVAAAVSAIVSGKLSDAKRDLDKAADQASASGQSYPAIRSSYGRLYDAMAKRAKTPDERLRLLKKAKSNYDAFASAGSGPKVVRARERSEELAEEIAELEGATP